MAITGNPEKVAREAVERELEKAIKQLSEAKAAAEKLINDSYTSNLREAEKKLKEEFARAEEQLKSLISVLELELKSKVSEAKNKYIDEVLEKARAKIKEAKRGADWYNNYMENIIKKLSGEVEGEMMVLTAPEDRELVQDLIEKYGGGKLKLSEDTVDILGGVIAVSPDGSTRVDYSLDLLVKMEEYRLRGVASKVLFKE
ncbi:MAG: hypothetical protein GSR73_06645 [Desulfurococcales archaeon]|nr:hypothetical protein [Desulfurococcales archaeon]